MLVIIPLAGGTHTLDITRRPITIAASRVYDGTTSLDGTSVSTTFTYNNIVGTEIITQTGTGSVASANVSSGQSVTLGSISLVDGSGAASNYSLTSATLDITRRPISLSGSRVYDATTTATSSNLSTLSNLVGSETLVLSNSGTIANKNVGVDKTVTVGSLSLGNGSNGGLGSNYTLSGGTHTLSVTKRPVTISGTRGYDGTITVSNSNINALNNRAGGETLSLTGSGSIGSAAVGSGKSITLGSLALADNSGSASNYSLSSGTFNVTAKNVTFVASRVYDGTTDVNSANVSTTFSGLAGSETLTLSGSGSVASKNVASGQSITMGSISLANGTGVSSNYSLTSGTLNITSRPINLSGSKVYDATTTATAANLSTIGNLVGSETLNLSGNAAVSDANVGATKTLTNSSLSGLSLANGSNGGLASNYNLSGGTHSLSITKRPVTISGSRFYDSTTVVNASDINTFNNLLSGQTLSITGTGSVDTAISGSGKNINLGSLTLNDGSGLASNYSLASGTFNVNARQLNVIGSRVYDGSTNVNGSDLVVATGIGSEVLTLTGSGSVGNANVANAKSVTQGSLAFSNGSGIASNYSFGTVTIDIIKKAVNLDGSKTYDGTTNVSASSLSINSGLIGSQTLTLSGAGSLSNKNVGVGKSVSIGTLSLGNGSNGGLASNYTLTGGTHTLQINPLTTNASGSKHYDGTNSALGSHFSSFTNLIGSDSVSFDWFWLIFWVICCRIKGSIEHWDFGIS